MQQPRTRKFVLAGVALVVGVLSLSGCGTTRSSDTVRTATEQLLLSDAVDQAVQSVDFRMLTGQTVYLDEQRLGEAVDKQYLISSLRQHLLASGCELRDKRDDAEFIVEARSGALGTDRNDLLFGVPASNVPVFIPLTPVPAAIPEIPIAKRRDQRGVAKIAVFAYQRTTGIPVFQSGIMHTESSANDVWILGAGPFQHGSIYEGTSFAGNGAGPDAAKVPRRLPTPMTQKRLYNQADQLVKQTAPNPPESQSVVQAAHQEPAATMAAQPTKKTEPPAGAPPAAKTPSIAKSTTPAESAPVKVPPESGRVGLLPPSSDNPKDAGAVARMLEEQFLRRNTSQTAQFLGTDPSNPVPLPQPRFSSP